MPEVGANWLCDVPQLRFCRCGSSDVFSIAPGSNALIVREGDRTVLLKRAVADVGWCKQCWIGRFGDDRRGQSGGSAGRAGKDR